RYCASVTLDGSTVALPWALAIKRAHSTWAWRFVPMKECHRRLRLPVCGSRTSITIAQWPGERSRICPLICPSPHPIRFLPSHLTCGPERALTLLLLGAWVAWCAAAFGVSRLAIVSRSIEAYRQLT